MNNSGADRFIKLVLIGFVVFFAVRYLWPLLLAAALYLGWQYYKAKKMLDRAQKEAEEAFRAAPEAPRPVSSLKEDAGEIIDAEFIVKDRGEEAVQGRRMS